MSIDFYSTYNKQEILPNPNTSQTKLAVLQQALDYIHKLKEDVENKKTKQESFIAQIPKDPLSLSPPTKEESCVAFHVVFKLGLQKLSKIYSKRFSFIVPTSSDLFEAISKNR